MVDLDEMELDVPKFDAYKYVADCVILLHCHCDGARTDDAMGFAGTHTGPGKRLGARLMNGYKMSAFEVIWCEKNLPYYMNTQLAHVDKSLFHECCKEIYPAAKARDEHYEQCVIEAEKQIEVNEQDALQSFMASSIEEFEEKDQRFAKSLQNFYKNNKFLSRKQVYWALLMLNRAIIAKIHERIYYPREN